MSNNKELLGRKLFSQFAPLNSDEPLPTECTPGMPMSDLIGRLMSRRSMLRGSAAAGAAGFVALGLTACGSDGGPAIAPTPVTPTPEPEPPAATVATSLNFESIDSNETDVVDVPEGYSARVLYAYGDPINDSLADFANDGSEAGVEFDFRSGDHHDGMYFFGMDANGNFDPTASERGILCVNHENISQELMHTGAPSIDTDGNRTDIDEVRKEQRAHGIACVEIARMEGSNDFEVVRGSQFNQRVTALTETRMEGPAAGDALLQTKFSPDGTRGRGTLNNCASGFTPWGTYLTCEENYDLYFRNDNVLAAQAAGDSVTPEVADGFANFLGGVGVRVPFGLYQWATLAGVAGENNDEFSRFNVTPTGASATDDYRNEANQFGYIVEIDPFNANAAPRKRTALGRFAHEGCWPSNIEEGSAVAFYMGDDDQLQFIYKFVSDNTFTGLQTGESPLDAGDRYMNSGTLYAAQFNEDSSGTLVGEWLALTVDNPALQTANASGQFEGLFGTEASIIVHARGAAFVAGATPMDRPEWGAVNPGNGEVYFTLTNNTDRRNFDDSDEAERIAGDQGSREELTEFLADREFGSTASSPFGRNEDGHIIRLREDGDDAAATTFTWDIFVFGIDLEDDENVANNQNVSGLDESNDFTNCDGIWFDDASVLWIQTDGNDRGNDQMLASIPGAVGDGGITTENNADNLRRFLVGPVDCEITGIHATADRRTLFVNIQHPGDGGSSVIADDPSTFTGTWPATSGDATEVGTAGQRARSATVMITRDDGGPIGSDIDPIAS